MAPLTFALTAWTVGSAALASMDLSVVPFWDGETSDGLLNRYGGGGGASFGASLTTTNADSRSGNGAVRIDTNGTIAAGGFGFVQSLLGPHSGTPSLVQARDLTRFESTEFYVRNDTGSPFTLKFEVQDDRATAAHSAFRFVPIDATPGWQPVSVPLDLGAPGWSTNGSPDLSRSGRLAYVIQADRGAAVNGSVLIDDAMFVEPGGPVDVATAPVNVLAERVAKRQFHGLWDARHRPTGLVPLHNTSSNQGAMNTSSALLKLLPGAVQRGWVNQAEAEQHVTNLVGSLNTMLDNGMYLPQRYVNLTTLQPVGGIGGEESSIDAAFMALALHQYKNDANVSPALAQAVDDVQNRFNFQPFSDTVGTKRGWKFAYRSGTGLTDGTYDSYSGEPWVISLAAALSDDFPVPIETQWNSAIFRTTNTLTGGPNDRYLVSSFSQFRPSFVQWLFPMFADTNDRGHDTYPNFAFAGNPEANALAYQLDSDAYFAAIGRGEFLQPDAGADGNGNYEQYSAYNNFGDPGLFMPWSVALALLGNPDAEAALRHHLANDLEGPLGLADSARWQTGAAEPTEVRAFLDFWNTSLSTMALVELLYNEAADFAALPEVSAALDVVFNVAGDYNRNGLVEQGDLNLVLNNWGRDISVDGVPAGWFNDHPRGIVDQGELNRVLNFWGSSDAPDLGGFGDSVVPEPSTVFALLGLGALYARRLR